MSAPDAKQRERGPRRLYRSRSDRLLGGVAGGLGRYFDLDPLIFRIGIVALAALGGIGVVLYALGWAFIPLEAAAGDRPAPQGALGRQALLIAGLALLSLSAAILLDRLLSLLLEHDWPIAAALTDPALLGLLAGCAWLWLRRRASEPGAPGPDAVAASHIALAVAVIGLLTTLALGSALAAASGAGTAAALVVVGAGVLLTAAAFANGGRWLIAPALTIAIAAGTTSVARVDVRGGVGDRYYRPASLAQLHAVYKLGVGRLELDLRGIRFQPGGRTIELKLGVGEAVVIVPRDVCVATNAHIGIGYVGSLERRSGGVEVSWRDEPQSPPGVPRLMIDTNIGFGTLEVADSLDRHRHLGEQSLGTDDACDARPGIAPGGEA